MTTGEKIKKRREELGLSADDLGQRIGVSRATIYRYENGSIESFPIKVLVPLAHALHVDPGYFISDGSPAASAASSTLSPFEQALIGAYRNASEDTKAAVCAVLGIKKE